MSTYADLQTRIARDFRRTDMATDIPVALLEAIRHFSDEPFYSADATAGPIASVIGQKEYDLPADFVQPIDDGLMVDAMGSKTPVELVSVQELDAWDVDTETVLDGIPSLAALHGSQFLVWPRPDQDTYNFWLRYMAKAAPPSLPSDSSTFWTNDGQDLIYHYARGLLERYKLKQEQWAQASFQQADQELRRLRQSSEARIYAAGRCDWDVLV